MNTYPVMTADSAQIRAFEIDHPYITTRSLARLLASTDGVTGIHRRRHSNDVKFVFMFRSHPYVVWEPHDRDGRYRIAADSEAAFGDDVAALRATFERYRPSVLRSLYGAFVTSWLFTRPFKKRHSRRIYPVRVG